MMPKENIWFAVVNVFAASRKAASAWDDAAACLEGNSVTYHCARTGAGGNAMELTMDACASGYRRFIAVGGDGTVHDVLNGIAFFVDWKNSEGVPVSLSDFTVAALPLGSGNDWVKSLGMTRDIPYLTSLIACNRTKVHDVVRVSLLDSAALPQRRPLNITYMMNVGGVGIDARVCFLVNRQKEQGKRGRILYVTSLLQCIRERKPSAVEVYCGTDRIFEGSFLSIAVGNGCYSGGGMRQTPEAVVDDGLLDMTIIPDIPMLTIAKEAPKLFTGRFLTVRELTAVKAKELLVLPKTGSGEPVEVDGEVVGMAPVLFEVLDDRINVIA